jgi:hypothetical protein
MRRIRATRWRTMTVESLRVHLDVVIASASEAIQGNAKELDCFVASAPRNDG